MSSEAYELRILAHRIERVARESRISSIAMPAVSALADYLTLRARVMELEGERYAWEDEARRARGGDPARPMGGMR